ncbi:hypothetical protein V1508DRAFT_426618 [Lipomyces doorenjongii]|uniref:uncharacterized protein n=1 Tax=Lipomyces doorenjongii TaxID=383834 RepID=UPI0034CE7297
MALVLPQPTQFVRLHDRADSPRPGGNRHEPFGAISSEESAKKMFDAVDALSVKDEFFLRNYDGSVLAW